MLFIKLLGIFPLGFTSIVGVVVLLYFRVRLGDFDIHWRNFLTFLAGVWLIVFMSAGLIVLLTSL